MGGGTWSADTYASVAGARVSSGTTFGYDRATRARGTHAYKAHESLDPKVVAGDGSPFAGKNVRESRDNSEHPNSTPISVIFDATGSMGSIPGIVQKKLAGLFGLLLRKGYVDDPQVMIGAYGDAYVDRVPLQISQFESDNRIDDNLDNLFLEGGGGGNMGETQTLAWYYLAHHTATDAWEKRGEKGYVFFIADERALDITPEQVKEHIGDGQPLGELTVEALAEQLKEKWDVYVLFIDNYSAKRQNSFAQYKELFGEDHIIPVQSIDDVSETIAVAIGYAEGTLDAGRAAEDLTEVKGANVNNVLESTKAITVRGGKDGTGVATTAELGFDINAHDGANRL